MANNEDDLELLLSMQDYNENDIQIENENEVQVAETPPASPLPGYFSDDETSRSQKPLGMDAFRDFVKDELEKSSEFRTQLEKKSRDVRVQAVASGPSKKSSDTVPHRSANDFELETYSGLRIKSRLVSTGAIGTRFSDIRFIRLQAIKNAMSVESIRGSWATIGVLIEKSSPKLSSVGKNYAVWKLGTLDKSLISLFLFGDAYTHHWKESPGSILCIFSAKVRRDVKGDDYSLSVYAVDQIVKMGTSVDYGICKGKRKDGKPCTAAINKSHGPYCQSHKAASQKKYITKRAELGGGTFQSALPKVLKAEGIYMVKPSLNVVKDDEPCKRVRIKSVEELKAALSEANRTATPRQSQGLRLLAKVANADKSDLKTDDSKVGKSSPFNECLKKRSQCLARETDTKRYSEPDAKRKKNNTDASDLIELEFED